MQFGFSAPLAGPLSGPDTMVRICTEGEAMGYNLISFSDHLVIPNNIDAKYPYSETGEFPGAARMERHEQLTGLAFIAAKTKTAKLLTSVMVVPHRPALLTAKILATIDVLSGGRLMVGIGAGWMEEEFVAVQTPPFKDRGLVTDEYMLACKELWTKEKPKFSGKYVNFDNIVFAPKPVQKPHPPIWVGGESGPALRRTARYADGWYPIGTNPAHRLDSLELFKAGAARLAKLTTEAGRDPKSVSLGYRLQSHGTGLPAKASDGNRRL
jgi:probable F420-dependent oxidoreductase